MSDSMPKKVRDKIIYAFPNFNGETLEVWELTNSLILHSIMGASTYSC